MIEILPLKNRLNIGLGIDGIDDRLLETVTFLSVNISAILTVRATIDRT